MRRALESIDFERFRPLLAPCYSEDLGRPLRDPLLRRNRRADIMAGPAPVPRRARAGPAGGRGHGGLGTARLPAARHRPDRRLRRDHVRCRRGAGALRRGMAPEELRSPGRGHGAGPGRHPGGRERPSRPGHGTDPDRTRVGARPAPLLAVDACLDGGLDGRCGADARPVAARRALVPDRSAGRRPAPPSGGGPSPAARVDADRAAPDLASPGAGGARRPPRGARPARGLPRASGGPGDPLSIDRPLASG